MRFGAIPVAEAEGAISAHAIHTGDVHIKKGTRLTAAHVRQLLALGLPSLIAAQLEADDVAEDEAAERLAAAVSGEGVRLEAPFTGRSNLFATVAGVLVVDPAAVDGINAVDERITIATLPAFKPVVPGEMVATVKIIPYAAPGHLLARAEQVARAAHPVVRVAPYVIRRLGVVSTVLPGLKDSVIAKTLRVLARRLDGTGVRIIAERRVAHAGDALAVALADPVLAEADLVIVFGASAIADRRDVIPAAIEAVGGRVERLGMPVDPGNLLLVGSLPTGTGRRPVIGAPGCARSPSENGFDWVLHRLLAGLSVSSADIGALGVGGLLMEIGSRPQPRAGGASTDEDDTE
ncbi:molybdopterin-binding protein [Chelatococcus reniformis]|uniref:MoaB/Mog domain-containing protein n=1 Tax=Chelatococcus reniformis TaxID=1494448 RepID=A0A916UTY1_9HYPH|nr:molybdopterin-binding protein [Chelatococcus reniformis]GGC84842.1 hypothetical protein GCM10010994_48410 [Chelatococcus reniformis]